MELDNWIHDLAVHGDRVLDIGGSQLPIKDRTRIWDVGSYVIGDLASPHKDSPKPELIIDLNGQAEDARPFDVIFCLEVFDYVYDPVNAFHIIAKLLNEGGKAYITFPSIYPLHQPIEDDALRYMPGGIMKLAESSGLIVEKMIPRRPESNLLDEFYRTERMRAAKHEDHNFTGWICEFSK